MKKNEPVRVGIVGLGRAGWDMHCQELKVRRRQFHVVAACDVEPARCERVAKLFGCRTYRRIEELIADPGIELVDIATRSPDHVAHAALALGAGKLVFLEKPIATHYKDALSLRRVAARTHGRLFIRHNRRFEPAFQHVREILATGVLGNVYEIKLRRHGYQRRNDWQTIIDCGGGQLLNWGSHIIDHALRFLQTPPVQIWSDLKRIAAVGDAEDHLKIILKNRAGLVVDLEISGGAALSEPEYTIFGTRGALISDGRDIRLRYLDPKRRLPRRRALRGARPMDARLDGADPLHWIEKTVRVAPAAKCTMESIWDHLYSAIRGGGEFPITLDEALGVMRVISQVRRGTPFEHGRRGRS